MTATDAYGWTADFPTWRGEVVARFRDFLERKKGVASDRWRILLQRMEESVSFPQIAATLRQVLVRLRREATEEATPIDTEFERLCEQILASSRKTTIENYGAYLFTVDLEF